MRQRLVICLSLTPEVSHHFVCSLVQYLACYMGSPLESFTSASSAAIFPMTICDFMDTFANLLGLMVLEVINLYLMLLPSKCV